MNYQERLYLASVYLQKTLQLSAPIDSGNLMSHGIAAVERTVDGKYVIVIGGENAPYAVYTNEKWIDKRWKGKANPNQGWVERAIRKALPTIKSIIQSEQMTQTDVEWLIETKQQAVKQKMVDRADELLKRGR